MVLGPFKAIVNRVVQSSIISAIIEYINITIKWVLRARSGIMDRIMKQLMVN